ncbi:O-antigen ligase family protein [Arthrobacter sedimenti]|uniref:O-antigen ligase family protein n=1 Tax=Arthrobacter sedimenti TaxID=2694931 RepID=UPI00142106DE|nr:O-antigen ligase family protein [Arthrobacter sedimenti]
MPTSRSGPPVLGEAKARTASAISIWIVLIISVTAWRKGAYFEGAFDTVVVAKAALQGGAFAMALLLRKVSPTAYPVAGGPLLAVLAVLAVSMIGALQAGGTTASGVLVVRIVLLMVTVVLLVSVFPREHVLRQLVIAIGVVGAVLAITGAGTVAAGGRLEGTLLPISPNELVLLCAVPALAAIHRVLSGHATIGAVVAAVAYTLACVATQSRTALLGVAVAIVVLVLSIRTIQRYVVVVMVASVPALFVVAAYTPLLGSLLNREGSTSNLTLNSRTIAWQVVLQTPVESLQKWVGAGMSVKTVNVRGQYWNEQVLDSSWVSALAQTGVIGTAILAVLVTAVLVATMRGGRRNALPVALLVFLLIRAFLETGLVDASVTFIVFISLASTFVPTSVPASGRVLPSDHLAPAGPSIRYGTHQKAS